MSYIDDCDYLDAFPQAAPATVQPDPDEQDRRPALIRRMRLRPRPTGGAQGQGVAGGAAARGARARGGGSPGGRADVTEGPRGHEPGLGGRTECFDTPSHAASDRRAGGGW